MALGEKIKEALNRRGKTICWLSEQTGINKQTLYSIVQRDSVTTKYYGDIKAVLPEINPFGVEDEEIDTILFTAKAIAYEEGYNLGFKDGKRAAQNALRRAVYEAIDKEVK